MSETNCSYAETDSSHAGRRNGVGRRGAVFAGLLFVAVGFIAWMEVGTWRHVRRLEHHFARVPPTTFVVGLRLQAGLETLTAALLRFRLSSDSTERNLFHVLARDLAELVRGTSWRTDAERLAAREAGVALEEFLRPAAPLLAEGVRGVRRDTAAEEHRGIREMTAPVVAVADRLVAAQSTAAKEFFAEAEQSLSSLRRWLVFSLVMFLLLIGGIAAFAYQWLVTPLLARLTETEAAAQRQERLASLGTLATGVAHEIRNPLAALKLRLFSLQKALPPEFAEQEDLTVIHGEVQRLDRIVKEFLQFARPAEPALKRIDVEPLLHGVGEFLGGALQRRNIRISVVPGEGLLVNADPDQLRQVLLNLIQNAADATVGEGTITLSARHGAARLSRETEPVVILDVADSGPGIAPEVETRMFDPFFSTKEGGTGLGLPIAARILENHGGCLQYSTRRGGGTVFSIVLPRRPADEPEPERETAADRG